MNLYSLSFLELMKLNREFSKTQFGRRARIFSMLPYIVFVVKLFLVLFIDNYQYNSTDFILIFLGAMITQLQYGNMLKDYVNSKNK